MVFKTMRHSHVVFTVYLYSVQCIFIANSNLSLVFLFIIFFIFVFVFRGPQVNQ